MESIEEQQRDTSEFQLENENLDRRSWHVWLLAVGMFVLTTNGLSAVIMALLDGHHESPWPWARTDFVLLAANIVLTLALVSYLTREQRRLAALKKSLQDLQKDIHERRQRRVYALFEVSRTMGLRTNPQTVFDSIINSCEKTFRCDQVSLMLFDEKSQKLEVRSANGHASDYKILGRQQKIGEGIAGWAAENEKALLLGNATDMDQYPELKLKDPSISSAMVVPIILRGELVGVVNVSSSSPDVEYDEEDLDALGVFAENAGTSIRQAEQTEWMRQTIENLQKKLNSASESLRGSN